MQQSTQIELWRNVPPTCPLEGESGGFPIKYVFPSGRQALGEALRRAGLSRSKRVACPEWSSHCVLSAVSRYATPIPMAEVVDNRTPVGAILLYEQWGWPIPAAVWEQLAHSFPQALFVWDRVDSADFLSRLQPPVDSPVADVCSLSKLLGLAGGGMLRRYGQFVEYQPDLTSALSQHILQSSEEVQKGSAFKEYFQGHREAVHPGVVDWMLQNSLSRALDDESAARRRNLQLLLGSDSAAGWETWMIKAVEDGVTAGIVPLLRSAEPKDLTEAASFLRERHQIDATVYHFNWSGSPILPKYEPCLAFPVHGMVHDLESALADLERFVPAQRTRNTD